MLDQNGLRKYLNQPERNAFLNAIDRSDTRRSVFCLTLLFTGCRISEALALQSSRIDLTQRTLVFETLKRRKRGVFRAVPVPSFLIRELEAISKDLQPNERIWPFSRSTGYRIVVDQMSKAGLTGSMACPKGLRHSYGIAMASRGVPITMIKRWLGHANLETTEIYLNFIGEDERELARKLWQEN